MPMLALPARSCTCEWCDTLIYPYGADTCATCQTLFDNALAAEQDFRCRLVGIARLILPEWIATWARRVPLEYLTASATYPLECLEGDQRCLIQGVAADLAKQYVVLKELAT